MGTFVFHIELSSIKVKFWNKDKHRGGDGLGFSFAVDIQNIQ
jgi:hypothetical protein